jgi:hypothetical protein
MFFGHSFLAVGFGARLPCRESETSTRISLSSVRVDVPDVALHEEIAVTATMKERNRLYKSILPKYLKIVLKEIESAQYLVNVSSAVNLGSDQIGRSSFLQSRSK